MVADQERNWSVNQQPYALEPLPRKVENFIKRQNSRMQKRINVAFESIIRSPFPHENPTAITALRGKKKGLYRYRIGRFRFVYRVDRDNRLIRIVEIDNRGDIY